MLIEAKNVSKTYGSGGSQVTALWEVTLTIKPGDFLSIMGPSGSGKSTFLSLLAGLDVPTEGTLLVEGEDIRKMNRDAYRLNRASVIYQAFHLFPLLTVMENVMFPMELQHVAKKEAKARAQEYLAQVDLPETLYRKMPGMISGGEQQRVAIARAMAAGGEILLADEPTGNLDSQNEQVIVNLLCKLAHDKNYAVIVVTHNEAVAAAADVVYGMKDGELSVVRGSKENVYSLFNF